MSSQRGARGTGLSTQLVSDLKLRSRALLISVFLLASLVVLILNPRPAHAQTSLTVATDNISGSLAEPGGNFTIRVSVTNPGPASVSLNSLTFTSTTGGSGNVGGSCATPQTIASTGTYTCEFTFNMTGDAGKSDTVVVTASGAVVGTNAPISGSDGAGVSITDDLPTINVVKTASPTSIAAPGGLITYTVAVTNTSDELEAITLTALSDNEEGDLDGEGTCNVPASIAKGATYTCSFTDVVTGSNGTVQTNIVTATANDDEGNTVTDTDDATVTIGTGGGTTNTITVTKTASPTSRVAPGGTFTFSFVVTNNSGGSVSLTTLSDNVYGNLDGRGTCDVPQTISNGSSYSCQFSVEFTGNAGKTETNTVTATATPVGGGSSLSDTDTETISITGTTTPTPITTFNPFNPFNPLSPFIPSNPFNPQNPFLPIGSTDTGRGPIVINNNNSSSSSSSAAAAASGGAVVAPPGTPVTLVRTGIEALPMAAGGMAVLLLGFVMLAAGKRRLIYSKIN